MRLHVYPFDLEVLAHGGLVVILAPSWGCWIHGGPLGDSWCHSASMLGGLGYQCYGGSLMHIGVISGIML